MSPTTSHPDLAVACLAAVWTIRPDMGTLEFAKAVKAVIVDDDVRLALITLWARRDHLTAAEVNALRAALGEPQITAEQMVEDAKRRWDAADDGGFAERFLEARRSEWQAQQRPGRHLRLVP